MRSQPSGGGRLFVGSAGGKVYALDAKRGCQRWVFDAGFAVRTAITIGQDKRGATAYFGDQRGEAYGLDAESGKLLVEDTRRCARGSRDHRRTDIGR